MKISRIFRVYYNRNYLLDEFLFFHDFFVKSKGSFNFDEKLVICQSVCRARVAVRQKSTPVCRPELRLLVWKEAPMLATRALRLTQMLGELPENTKALSKRDLYIPLLKVFFRPLPLAK